MLRTLLAFDGRPCPNVWAMASTFGKVRRHKGTLYLDFGRVGKLWSLKGTGFDSELQAEQILRAIQGDVARGTPKKLAVEKWLPTSARAHRVERWLKIWLEDMRALEKAGERSPSYLREIEKWCDQEGPRGHLAALGRRSIHELDYATLRAWQREISERSGLEGKSLWNVTAGLSSFLGFLVRCDVLERKPPIPWPRFDEHVPQIVRPEVQDAILEAIPEPKRGIFLAMALLGMRHGEAWALDGTDYRDGRFWVRRARKGQKLSAPVRGTKNRRPRVLPVPAALAAWIERNVPRERLAAGGPLFRNPRTKRAWSAASFRRVWARACAAAGLPVLKPYETLRHSTATEWLRRGATEREVQELLGHRSGHSTPRYARLAEGRLEAIVDRKN